MADIEPLFPNMPMPRVANEPLAPMLIRLIRFPASSALATFKSTLPDPACIDP
jgi:hypothetical protein